MLDLYKPILGVQPLFELDAQRLRNTLNAIKSDLTSAIQSINDAKTQLPNLLTSKAAEALTDALQKQATQLQSSLSAINTLLKGV